MIVCNQKGIDPLALDMLAAEGILALRRVNWGFVGGDPYAIHDARGSTYDVRRRSPAFIGKLVMLECRRAIGVEEVCRQGSRIGPGTWAPSGGQSCSCSSASPKCGARANCERYEGSSRTSAGARLARELGALPSR